MNQTRRMFFVLSLLIFPARVCQAQDAPEKYALLIGVTNYAKPELNTGLKFPEKDAEALAEILKASGFQVELLLGRQATKRAIDSKLASFSDRGKHEGVIFVAMCGHGTEFSETKKSYFCPHDTKLKAVRDKDNKALFNNDGTPMMAMVPDSMIAIDEVLIALRDSNAANRILVADCCRDDPNRARGRSFGSSLTSELLPLQTLMLLGCSSQEKSLERDNWGHGALTKCLLDEMQTTSGNKPRTMGNIAEEVIPAVKQLVADTRGNDKQTPRLLSTGRVELMLTISPGSGLPIKEMEGRSKPMPTAPKGNANSTRPNNTKSVASKAGQEAIVILANGVSITFCWIPEGTATLGSPVMEPQRQQSGLPETEFEFATQGFWLAKFETTQEQWTAITKTGSVSGKNLPMANITFREIEQFIQTLNGNQQLLQSARTELGAGRFHIPIDDQWEYACRGGLGNQRAFYWGNSSNGKEANMNGEYPYPTGTPRGLKVGHATPFGTYATVAPHPWGLCDMHGNVWEYCRFRDGGDKPVIRGGSYFDPGIWQCRAAYRDYQNPIDRLGNFGFRVAYETDQQ